MNKLIVCAFALTASVAVASPTVVDLTALARTEKKVGTATSSSAVADRGPGKAFDGGLTGNSASVWRSTGLGEQYLQYQFNTAFHADETVQVLAYGIYFNGDYQGKTSTATCQIPKSWTFQGSDDGEAWTVLDARENFTDWSSGAYRYFPCGAAATYRYYRLVITAAYGASATCYSITEMSLMGCIHANAEEMSSYKYWTSREGDWTDAANWSPAGVPTAEDEVVVGSSGNVMLSSETERVVSLVLGGTMTMSGDAACLKGGTLVVNAGGVMTCAEGEPVDGNLLTQQISRVQVSCTDLNVQTGGKIDVSKKGWISKSLPQGGSTSRGYGPGSTPYASSSSSHGGFGVLVSVIDPSNGSDRSRPLVYDDPVLPTMPGSSGSSSGWGRGGNGGGVALITATGSITVNGSISADGGPYSGSYGCAGSGGTVSIACETLSGSGVISAAGGNGNAQTAQNNQLSLPGGGGCIAIRYDTTKQTPGQVAGMRISASDGVYEKDPAKARHLCPVVRGCDPDLGTVWFSDDKIVRQLLGNGLMGQIKNVPSYTHEGDLTFSYGVVRFADEGANVTITGDLTFDGDDLRLEVGGCMATNRSMYTDVYAGQVVNRLTVGGDLTLAGVSRLDVRAAETNGTDLFGAVVKVGGTLSIATNCFLYAWSDPHNGGAPHFEVGNLNVAAGAVFSAAERGGSGGRWSEYYAYGNSSGKNGSAGGGHGGAGGMATATSGCVSGDSAERPRLPGSGGGSKNTTWAWGGNGGGVISVSASNGAIRIDGTVTADGTYGYRYGGGGAGGTILMEAKSLAVGETGVLTAQGGTTAAESAAGGGAGGGGRIALWCGEPWTPETPARRCRDFTANPMAYPDVFTMAGRVCVDGGKNTGVASMGADGSDGTIRYFFLPEAPGLMLLVR